MYIQLSGIVDLVADEDLEVASLIAAENKRQSETIPLIPSENIVSTAVAAALSSCLTNKYAEGYPHKWTKENDCVSANGRYYQGQANTNQLEQLLIDRALELFVPNEKEKYHANVQPLSGAPANLAVLSAFLQPGDTFMGLSLDNCGHLTHGHKVNITGKFFSAIQYGLDKDGVLDYAAIEKMAMEKKPKIIVCGATAYPLPIDFARFGEIAKKCGALLLADVSHIAGLIAGGAHASCFPYADIMTTTTHKTLRGPRAGLIICKKELGAKIDKALFPGLQGGPHMNTMAALAVALKEALQPSFKDYAHQIITNAKALAWDLKNAGFKLIGNGTENHLILMDVVHSDDSIKVSDASQFAQDLETAHLVANKNAVPGDLKPWIPSGIRLGTPAVTTLGMKEPEMHQIAGFIIRVAHAKGDQALLEKIGQEVKEFVAPYTNR